MERTEKNREFILKALIDPGFRKALKEDPAKALGMREFTEVNKQEVRLILAAVKGIDTLIAVASDELLCAYGPKPCGIG